MIKLTNYNQRLNKKVHNIKFLCLHDHNWEHISYNLTTFLPSIKNHNVETIQNIDYKQSLNRTKH